MMLKYFKFVLMKNLKPALSTLKRSLLTAFAAVITLTLASWGPIGHSTIGKIAQNHITPKTEAAVEQLLDGQSLAQVSNYADEIRSRETKQWHYINLPAGLSFDRFSKILMNPSTSNAYTALLKFERVLINPKTNREEKIFALKFIIHLIGDIHQPMHVSHAYDHGGNDIRVNFNHLNGSLHGLWDSGLILYRRLNYWQFAQTYDPVSATQIKNWQNDAPITWVWESYQISEKLYAEAARRPAYNNVYYRKHFPIAQQRLLQAGIRLAGVLNEIFDRKP